MRMVRLGVFFGFAAGGCAVVFNRNLHGFGRTFAVDPAICRYGCGAAAGIADLLGANLYEVRRAFAVGPVFVGFGDGDGFRIGAGAGICWWRYRGGRGRLSIRFGPVHPLPIVDARAGFGHSG